MVLKAALSSHHCAFLLHLETAGKFSLAWNCNFLFLTWLPTWNIYKSVGFISHIQLGNSPWQTFCEGGSSFQSPNRQIRFFIYFLNCQLGTAAAAFQLFLVLVYHFFSFVPLTHWLRSVASTHWFLSAKKKNEKKHDWRRSSPELLNVDEWDFSPAAAGGADEKMMIWRWHLWFEVSRLKRWRWDKLCPHLQMLFRGFLSWHNHRQGRRKQSPQHTQSSLGEAWYSLLFLLFFYGRSRWREKVFPFPVTKWVWVCVCVTPALSHTHDTCNGWHSKWWLTIESYFPGVATVTFILEVGEKKQLRWQGSGGELRPSHRRPTWRTGRELERCRWNPWSVSFVSAKKKNKKVWQLFSLLRPFCISWCCGDTPTAVRTCCCEAAATADKILFSGTLTLMDVSLWMSRQQVLARVFFSLKLIIRGNAGNNRLSAL